MPETPSRTDPELLLLNDIDVFRTHTLRVVEKARREVQILSSLLDPGVYDCEEMHQALVDFVRRDRNCEVRILVKDIRQLVEQGHYLLRLSRRLSSKVQIRKLGFEPKDKAQAWLMADRSMLVYKHDDAVYDGFVNYSAKVECLELDEEFRWLWQSHSELHPSLRTLHL